MPDLFDAAAERSAMISGRNVNQERIEITHGAPSTRRRDTPDGSFDDHPAFWEDVEATEPVREVQFAIVFVPPFADVEML